MERTVLLTLFIVWAVVFATTSARADKKTIPIAISPRSAIVNAGQTVQFTAITDDHSRVVWSVNGTAGGSSIIGTIDADGNYTAPLVAVNTTVVVSIATKRDPNNSATASVSVVAYPSTFSVLPESAVVGSGQVQQFVTNFAGGASGVLWSVNGITGGNSTIGIIDAAGNFMAPAVTQNSSAIITATSKTEPSKSASASATIIAPGVVVNTANVQVASYTITPPSGGNVSIEFGPDTNYGLNTWQQSANAGGDAVTILVAGMKLNSTYHMRAVINLADGTEFQDVDHTFTTGTVPADRVPNVQTTTTKGAVPQSGVELLALISLGGPTSGVVVTNLDGDVIWSYPDIPTQPNPVKLLPNGHFLINFSGAPDGNDSHLREVDLAGQTVWELTGDQLNQELSAAACAGCHITVVGMHHDFVALPNGHVIVLASEDKQESGLVGFPSPTTVTGDVIIDLDENHKPVWVWSSFEHLDLNRHLMGLPDWTHTNSVVYSPDDKSLIVSMRHQSWVLKIDYNDGQGTGDIIWRLGYQGDFTLNNGTDPRDWFYAQHDANIISANSSGIFQLLLFDDGNARVLDASGTICGTTVPCDSRVPILQVDENAKTATIEWIDREAPLFSFFGGSSRLLQNGNVELDNCGLTITGTNTPANGSSILEVTKTTPPHTVWRMQLTGQYAYRGIRIPSLYPGVQW